MFFLAQYYETATQEPTYVIVENQSYLISSGMIGLLLAVCAAVILGRKGYTAESVLVLFFTWLCPVIALLCLISALTREDKHKIAQEQWRDRQIHQRMDRQRRQIQQQQQQLEQVEYERRQSERNQGHFNQYADLAATPQQTGQIRCHQCGSMNAEERRTCWHCGLDFYAEVSQQSSGSSYNDEATPIVGSVATVQNVEPRIDADATPIAPMEPVVSEPTEIKVRCKACNKKFSGKPHHIRRLKKCPRCGVTPFESETVT